MGKVTGFMEYARREETATSRSPSAQKHYKEFVVDLDAGAGAKVQGARCMDCGIPFCNNGCPVNNIIPDFNDLVYRDDWKQRVRGAALDQQLPRVHRPHLPGAVRGGLHAQHQRRRRSASSRSSTPSSTGPGHEGWVVPRPPQPQDRQEGRRRRLRPGRPGGAQQLARAGHDVTRVREERPHRRPAALRHPRLQDGEDRTSTAASSRWRPKASSSAPACWSARQGPALDQGHRAAHRAGNGHAPSSCAEEFDAVRADRRRRAVRATCRCRAASSTASISRWSSCRSRTRSTPATRSRARSARRWQARDRDRRRRHRLRLRRHQQPPRRRSA